MKIGELIGLARELKGLTLRDLEAATGVSNALISQIETGKVKNPGFKTVVSIATALNLSLDRLAQTVKPFRDTSMLRAGRPREVEEQVRSAVLRASRPSLSPFRTVNKEEEMSDKTFDGLTVAELRVLPLNWYGIEKILAALPALLDAVGGGRETCDAVAPPILTSDAIDGIVHLVGLDVAELPDRTSPDDMPDMMLVTGDELEGIVRSALQAFLAYAPAPSGASPRPSTAEKALREALEPFARLLDTESNGYESSPDNAVVRSVGTLGDDYAFITVGDLRRAVAALASPSTEGWRGMDLLARAACAAERVLKEWGYGNGDMMEEVCATILAIKQAGHAAGLPGAHQKAPHV